jgi:hypothetical protein
LPTYHPPEPIHSGQAQPEFSPDSRTGAQGRNTVEIFSTSTKVLVLILVVVLLVIFMVIKLRRASKKVNQILLDELGPEPTEVQVQVPRPRPAHRRAPAHRSPLRLNDRLTRRAS